MSRVQQSLKDPKKYDDDRYREDCRPNSGHGVNMIPYGSGVSQVADGLGAMNSEAL
jgi:hypothetical protein